MFGLGTPEIILIAVVVLVLFGAPKLPEFARSIGKSMRIFKEEANTIKREFENTEPSPTSTTTTEKTEKIDEKTIDVEAKVESAKKN